MTAKFGLAFGRWTSALLAVVALSFVSTTLLAQETSGKIEGTVLDPNGQPVAGAQILIVGTAFSAQTNPGGYYFINNVPTGNYNMRAQFIGLQPAEVQNVRVSGGQTITVDYNLQGAIALEAIAITAAENPLVPRDHVTSRSILRGSDLDRLPFDDPNQLITIAPGVTVVRAGAISIRGGRANEAAIFIDGAPVRSNRLGSVQLNLPANALEEIAVTSGALGAAFGDAQSGVVSFVTKAGGPNFAGSFSYETDEPFGDAISVGFNRVEGSLSGPIMGNLTFFVGGTVTGQASRFQGSDAHLIPFYIRGAVDSTFAVERAGSPDSLLVDVPQFVQFSGECEEADNFGFECQGRRQPNDWTTGLRLSGKLQLTYGAGSRISLSALTDRDQGLLGNMSNSLVSGNSALVTDGTGGFRGDNQLFVLNWVQQVTRGTSSALAFDVNMSYQKDEFIDGLLEHSTGSHRDPSLGIVISPLEFIVDFDHFSDDDPATSTGTVVTDLNSQADWDQLVFNIRTGTGTIMPYLNRFELNRTQLPRLNPYGVTALNPWNNTGTQMGTQLSEEKRFTFRANVDLQAGRFNRLKFGGEFRSATLNHFRDDHRTASGGQIRFLDAYTGDPTYASFYGQDRLDLGDVVLEFGLRWDRYDGGVFLPIVPGRIFTHPDFTATDFDPTDPDVVDADVFRQAESHTAISPRLRVSFPITEKTGFRLSYAHQVQTPRFADILDGANNDLSFTNRNDRFGGDVDFARTIQFEFGVRHAFSRDMVLDVAAYHKEKNSDWAFRIIPFFDPFQGGIDVVNILTNADFGSIRGVNVQIQRRFSNVFSGQGSYNIQEAQGTGSDPADFLNNLARQLPGITDTVTRAPPAPVTELRTRDDRRHTISASGALTLPSDFSVGLLRNSALLFVIRARSGLPYTRIENTGVGTTSDLGFGLGSNAIEPLQSSETPWEKFFDVRVTKGIALGGTNWTIFGDFRNILNIKNKPVVFSATGGVEDPAFFERSFLLTELIGLANDAETSGLSTVTTDGVVAIDLGNDDTRPIGQQIGANCSLWEGTGGEPACFSLVRAEDRFGNGDGLYDVDEQQTAIQASFDVFNGPHTFFGAPRHIRVGIQVDF